ncbi:sensor histidine kinase [Chelatococcus composti]|uniref:C4-dicarboxylate transport sensor protein DctB n=1 Tax=Chelatococcus composti TaxID=1743235 RepID=A0A841K317_9HYPH|nr:sensor histidine kinase [Chelatococcus composti]MBB6166907.1 two-component system C4-dicarboxylate transport sensor histidine kinase DctB [Chelatococcus composti]MBS7734169.1 sensor histidine kinase [Chelatococcus composti]
MNRHRRRHLIILGAVAFALCLLIASFGHRYATALYLDEAAARGHNTLGLAVTALRGQLARYEKLPQLIADDPDIKLLVSNPQDREKIDEVNHFLKQVNHLLESSDIYVMLNDGVTIAASNFDQTPTFIGENFSYRPYFHDARDHGEGRFFALGTTSLKRGYYFGAPIRTETGVAGVVAFKIDLDAIESSWRGSDYEIIVTDREGIIFMSGRQDWLFTAIEPLTPDRLARTAATRRYANAQLRELPVTRSATPDGHDLLTVTDTKGARQYLALSEEMPEADWTVRVLLDTASVRVQVLTTIAALVLLVALGAMGFAVWLERRARLAERLQVQREAQEELERRVAERTADLANVNHLLQAEVAERRATERALRKTQADLVQAGKLAALGQMAAALSHEFNQPLAAARTYADNALLLIAHGRNAEAAEAIERIVSLTERMASISRHLRNFARKPNEKLGPVRLDDIIHDTLEIMGWRLKAADADFVVNLGPGPLWVKAGTVRLQQVLVNIISNAADAVEGTERRTITLAAERTGEGKVAITVRDHGPGIPAAIAGRIFDPFFTTKGVGKGLGLGLSISYNIVKDFGGTLSVEQHPEGGTIATIVLDEEPPAQSLEAAE